MIYGYALRPGKQNIKSLDADAAAYIAAVKSAGATVTGAQSTAINTFILAEKTASRWSGLKRFYLPVWGVASANAICMKSLASGTWNGSVTHSSGYVQGDGSTGFLRCDATPSAQGLSASSSMAFSLVYQAPTADGAFWGVYDGGSAVIQCLSNLGNTSSYCTSGTTAFFPNIARASQNGIIITSRSSTTSHKMFQRKTSGITTLGSNTGTESVPPPNIKICFMARGLGASSQDLCITGKHGVFGMGLGLSDSDVTSFTSNLKTLWETVTGLTLP